MKKIISLLISLTILSACATGPAVTGLPSSDDTLDPNKSRIVINYTDTIRTGTVIKANGVSMAMMDPSSETFFDVLPGRVVINAGDYFVNEDYLLMAEAGKTSRKSLFRDSFLNILLVFHHLFFPILLMHLQY